MHTKTPLVSIITIVYNGEKYIEDTINSVLAQSYEFIEYIIVDGGSTDNTCSIVKKFGNKIAKFISEKDKGISDAFNKGIALATGQLVGIINADDWYEPDAIEKIVNLYTDDNTIISGNVKLYNSETKYNIKASSLDGLRKQMTIWHPGTFVPKAIYDKIGVYALEYKVLMDYDFVVRCFMGGVKFKFTNHTIASMRYGGVSNRLISKSMKESYDIKNKYWGISFSHKIERIYFNVYYQVIIFLKGIIYK
ncbi:glycosyltransferase [Mucilaginibacter sp. SMC90]|uniref:glycosyltransferase family 2 protein n=1 Tax=Mucilaginibacter sp. SMC90 TaxID=2929803 RepID=UPI001FB1A6AF|nr:glycosyltransferase family 2 protein [Mucilaginibacter sp. SMC90]UOE48191.1 glycosyltransferase [Mucilaginibacter sp. SMC90]